ncbi:hypothetical protein MATR_08700 [Marivirga tractuosa]|uniref:Uncharacterized protein n=1 Tax=Marivirga tractuosa (strain ATCC 23168 / DSM 4126 / NBRC 15989 / NCIMB 1408 / VKM B-1430 / H-43) TaxID=643867 RepID=E4TNR4_MARTH|nr:hypothetical protein [Marivirga tractuosa]ADR21501.1 hypothetical protein Ftrac_1511 [Marivirga tractuosa DSM 4126]BDD14045.1 hypothetical protein MATR_08700 [Marivirga tractuosa]
MREYEVFYKDGTTVNCSAEDKTDLIKQLFGGSDNKFIDEVKLLKWTTGAMVYTQDPSHNKIDSEITTADANPYGWRNEGELKHDPKNKS